MIQRTVGYFVRIAVALSLLLVMMGMLLVWRVSVAPLRLDFLAPYLQRVLTLNGDSYRLTLGGASLHWVEWKQTLDIQAIDVEMRTSTDRPVVILPALSLSLSLKALVQGQLALHTIEVQNSCLRLRRTTDGLLTLDLDAPGEGGNASPFDPAAARATSQLIENLLVPSDTAHPTGSLKRIRLIGGTVILNDQVLGVTWIATDINLELARNHEGIGIDGRLLLQTTGEAVPVTLSGHQTMQERQTNLTLGFTNLRPATLALPPLQALTDIDLPMSGTLSIWLGKDWQVQGGRFFVTGGPGIITLPWPFVTRYDVRSLTLQGMIGPDLHSLTLDRGSLDLGGPRLELVAAILWMPLPDATILRVPHTLQNGRKVKKERGLPPLPPMPSPGLKPLVPLSPLLPLPVSGLTVAANVTVHGIPLNDLIRYWPTKVASDPRAWIAANLRDGLIEQARFTARLGGPDSAGLAVESLYGVLTVRDATISYLAPMPPIRHATAVVTFYPDRLEVQAEEGRIQGLRLTDGKVVITGLDQVDQFCTITLTIVGPMIDALHLLDSKPLGYATTLGLQSEQAEGIARIQLALTFPVEKSLTLERIKVKAQARLSNLTLADLVSGRDLVNGDLTIAVDNEKLHLEGQATLAGTLVRLEWDEFFNRYSAPVRSYYKVRGRLDEAQRAALGLDFAPFMSPFLSGSVETDLHATMGFDGFGTATIEVDLTAAGMEIPGLGWHKPVGQPGRATACLHFTTATMREISRFIVQAGEAVALNGRAIFTPAGQLERVTFDRIQAGRTDLAGTLTLTPTGSLDLHLTGPAFDLEPLLKLGTNAPFLHAPSRDRQREDPPGEKPDLVLELAVARLWGSREGFLSDATLTARREGSFWQQGSLEALTEAKYTTTDADKETARGMFKATLASPPSGEEASVENESYARVLAVASEDAGAVLRAFGLFDNMIGGRMQMDAILDKANTLRGTVQVKNYRLVNAPLLARLLTMAALTGILEALTGDGIRFTNLNMPFVYHDGVLSLTSFHTSGPSLGLTATGKLFPQRMLLKVEGTIVPIYFINSLLGNVPVLGDLFTGEKGGGLFAATYTMNGTFVDPAITVNPLTVVTPGFLRNLFKLFKRSADQILAPPATDSALLVHTSR